MERGKQLAYSNLLYVNRSSKTELGNGVTTGRARMDNERIWSNRYGVCDREIQEFLEGG